jgi:hypothetical protein
MMRATIGGSPSMLFAALAAAVMALEKPKSAQLKT